MFEGERYRCLNLCVHFLAVLTYCIVHSIMIRNLCNLSLFSVHTDVIHIKPKGELNVVKISQGGSWARVGMSRCKSNILASPLPVSAKSSNKFDYKLGF